MSSAEAYRLLCNDVVAFDKGDDFGLLSFEGLDAGLGRGVHCTIPFAQRLEPAPEPNKCTLSATIMQATPAVEKSGWTARTNKLASSTPHTHACTHARTHDSLVWCTTTHSSASKVPMLANNWSTGLLSQRASRLGLAGSSSVRSTGMWPCGLCC